MANNIVIVGLGPGSWGQVTVEARDILNKTSADKLYFRTKHHPALDNLSRSVRDDSHSFDALFISSPNFDAVQTEIAAQIVQAANNATGGQPIVYAVPGHPMVGEASVRRVMNRAEVMGISVHVVAGISFIESVCTALSLDPLAAGMQVLDSAQLAVELETSLGDRERNFYFSSVAIPFTAANPTKIPTLLTISPNVPLLLAQVYNEWVARAVQRSLREVYPAEHIISLVRGTGTEGEQVVAFPVSELAAQSANLFSPLTCLYVPPLPVLSTPRSFDTLVYITGRLQGPNGCPWDKEQTHQSIKQNLIEETYEAVDALDALTANDSGEHRADNLDKFAEELGDVLLQVVFQAQMATIAGEFTLGDVVRHVSSKLVRRHPHVFADVQVSGSGEVLQNWEEIKKAERAAKAKANQGGLRLEMSEGLKGISRQLPALHYAQEVQSRVARIGFDWPDIQGVLDKIREEIVEVIEADDSHRREEFGDLLFASVNLGRWLGLDVEETLRLANQKFIRRFTAVERKALTANRQIKDMTPAEVDALWNEVKAEE